MTYPTISDNEQVQAAYVAMLRAGQSHLIAEQLALRAPPADKADRTFLADLAKRPDAEELKLRQTAEKCGLSVSGATYLRGLARKGMGGGRDPLAWIRSRDDVKRVAEERKLFVDGAISCDYLGYNKPVEVTADLDPGPNPQLIEEETRDHERKTGVKLRGKERTDFKEKTFNKRKGKSKAKFQAKA